MIVKLNNNIVDYKFQVFFFFQNATNPSFFFFNVGLCLKKKENMQHMRTGTHTVNWSHQPCVDVTPPRASLEPGFLAWEAGALTRNAKGYSL